MFKQGYTRNGIYRIYPIYTTLNVTWCDWNITPWVHDFIQVLWHSLVLYSYISSSNSLIFHSFLFSSNIQSIFYSLSSTILYQFINQLLFNYGLSSTVLIKTSSRGEEEGEFWDWRIITRRMWRTAPNGVTAYSGRCGELLLRVISTHPISNQTTTRRLPTWCLYIYLNIICWTNNNRKRVNDQKDQQSITKNNKNKVKNINNKNKYVDQLKIDQ